MSYTLNYVFTFQNLPGLTLNAAIYDAANPTPAQVGSTITAGFSEIGYGTYSFWATIPDGHVGAFVVWDSAQPSRRIAFSINPQEGEYNINDIIGVNGANLTALAAQSSLDDLSVKIGNPDGVSVSDDIAQLTTNLNDVAIAVSALNNITAADVVTALMAYAVESGKDYATVLKEVYAILRGKFVANAADPTSVEFYAPDGTTVRVTHTLTDTTRTPS